MFEEDANLLFSNPALIFAGWDNQAAVNFINYYADVSLGSAAYAKDLAGRGTWALGLQYYDLGEFVKRDATGNDLGEFGGSQYFIVLGSSRQSGNFRMGVSLKYAHSAIDTWSAGAVMVDIGGIFIHPEQDLTVGLIIKNLGLVLDDYTVDSKSRLPLDIQLGATIKPEHMPFRFSLSARRLNQSSILYDDGSLAANNESPGIVDKILSHVVVGAEAILSKNFNIRGGYNHLTNNEMRLTDGSKGAGFSFGFMLKVRGFEFAFSRAIQHAGEGSSFFSLQSDLNSFFKKDNKQEQ